MARLTAVPNMPPRAILYLRQSVSRDESISLELQEAAGRDYCLRSGYQVIGVESDPGISGRTWKRPAVNRVMAMVEAGDADVVVLWKWSRLSRSRLDWAVAVDKVTSVGGRIESATEAVDVSTAMGKLARGMMTEFAAFESDRIGEVWREVHASRLADGRTPNGKPKWGYRWNTDLKLHEPDAVTAPVIAEAYRRYVAGESFYALVRWMNNAGYRTLANKPWSDVSLRRVLDAGFAAGLIPWRGVKHPGIHQPLIEADTWQAFLDARARRRQAPPRRERSQYLLSGLVRCARCDGPMVAGQYGASGEPRYRCATGKAKGPEVCSGGYVMAHFVEAAVLDWLEALAADVDKAGDAKAGTAALRLSGEGEQRRLAREVIRIDESLHRLTVQVAEGLVPAEAYASARDELVGRRNLLVEQVDELGRRGRSLATDPTKAARGLLEGWRGWPVAQRRQGLALLMSSVRVMTGRPRATFEIVPTWPT